MRTGETINNRIVQIDWEIDYNNLIDDAGDGHVFIYEATGEDIEGNHYYGGAVICDGEFDQIELY